MNNQFIKVVDPDFAKQLADLGFQYMKEQNVFVFSLNDELQAVLQRQYSTAKFVIENKLRF